MPLLNHIFLTPDWGSFMGFFFFNLRKEPHVYPISPLVFCYTWRVLPTCCRFQESFVASICSHGLSPSCASLGASHLITTNSLMPN